MRYTVTAALPYTNGPIHIGHLAGVYIPADIYVRYLRLQQQDVLYVCGSDEHGAAISMKAKKESKTPQQIIDYYHGIISQSFQDFGISFDNYSRTSSQIHHQTASDFFKKMYEEGLFEEVVTDQLYDDEAKSFLADRYVTGTCPKCNAPDAYGDQCEKCGTSLSANDLINPKSTLTGSIPTKKSTKHWFLPLDKYSDFLYQWVLEDHKDDWKTNVKGQIKSWLDDGLKPRAVTRDLDWGIPVPIAGAEGKVLYVWFDAPIGYISATKEWAEREHRDWEPYWKDKDTKLVHFIGKDNIVFHGVIFPSMLKAHGDYILPENVPANEFLNLEGDKLSTSKNWAVWLHEYLQEFEGNQDALRYVLTTIMPETKDSDFSWKDFQSRNNNELVAIFGNFVNRVFVLTGKYYDGHLPKMNDLSTEDNEVLAQLRNFPKMIGSHIEQYRFRDAIQEFMNVARLGNKYLADQEPWKTIKIDEQRTETVMYVSWQIVAALAVLSEPFLPFSSEKLYQALDIDREERQNLWNAISQENLMPSGKKINPLPLLFQKIEDEQVQQQIDKLEKTKNSNILQDTPSEIVPQKESIDFETFSKMDIRVGTIIEAEKIAKADKLLKLTVDVGVDVRTIVSGIAKHYTPEELIGKQVSVLINLAPRKMRGVESQGMILMSDAQENKLAFVSPEDKDGIKINNGSIIR